MNSKTATPKFFNFDWDDNIMFLPTKIIIFHKETKAEVALSTHEFAHVRTEVGTTGKYADYEIQSDETKLPFSFREFRDKVAPAENTFLPQVIDALCEEKWEGPSFAAFKQAMSCPETASETTIITARGHEPESMLEALVAMQEIGYIDNVPKLENIYPCSSRKMKGVASHPSKIKTEVLMDRLNRLNDRGTKSSFGFSDDDFGTYKMVKEVLEPQVIAGRWPNVEIVLYFTGPKPETVILTKEGTFPFVEDTKIAA